MIQLLTDSLLSALLQLLSPVPDIILDLISLRSRLRDRILHCFCGAVAKFKGPITDVSACLFAGAGRKKQSRCSPNYTANQQASENRFGCMSRLLYML